MSRLRDSPTGAVVPIAGHDANGAAWQHFAFVPDPLPAATPPLTARTHAAVADARAALAALDSSARQLPDPGLLRQPTLRREAQSTSALEGTYAPLEAVLATDAFTEPGDGNLREVWNYMRTAEYAFSWTAQGRPVTAGLLIDLQHLLVTGTAADTRHAHRIRDIQVMIGATASGNVATSRYVPPPPGPGLEGSFRDLVDWLAGRSRERIDPVIAAGMAHYQFEALHPFNDGNGRIGRLLVVLQLVLGGALTEPTLSVSPWFEARRGEYYDHLLAVGADGDWDGWLHFFASGLQASAQDTNDRIRELLRVQADLKERIAGAGLRAVSALQLIDYTLQQPIFTVGQLPAQLGVTYARANRLVAQLTDIGVLTQHGSGTYGRAFTAPDVLAALLR